MFFRIKKTAIFFPKTFQTKKGLSVHIKTCEPKTFHHENIFACKKCGLSFATKINLTKHINTHKKENFICQYCDKHFSNITLLNKHIETHTIDYSFKCDSCLSTFPTNRSILLHRQTCFAGIKLVNQVTENKCYVNASVNAIASVDQMRRAIINSDIENSNIIEIFKKVLLPTGRHESHDVHQLRSIVKPYQYDNKDQHDAGEFLGNLLDSLVDKLPILHPIFSFNVDSFYKCPSDNYEKMRHDAVQKFYRLSLLEDNKFPIKHETNIQLLINKSYQPYDDGTPCDKCKNKWTKKELVHNPPNTLFLQLMRFDYKLRKINTVVTPSLNITFHNKSYRLKCIIEHHGHSIAGHYKTVIYSNSECLVYNDDQIEKQPSNSSGYIYIYEHTEHSETEDLPMEVDHLDLNIPLAAETNDNRNAKIIYDEKNLDKGNNNETHEKISKRTSPIKRKNINYYPNKKAKTLSYKRKINDDFNFEKNKNKSLRRSPIKRKPINYKDKSQRTNTGLPKGKATKKMYNPLFPLDEFDDDEEPFNIPYTLDNDYKKVYLKRHEIHFNLEKGYFQSFNDLEDNPLVDAGKKLMKSF